MKAFGYVRATSAADAADAAAREGAVLKAGGTDLLDRMKERVDEPETVVTLDDPELRRIEVEAGRLLIGALATLADIESSEKVRQACPPLARAARLAASPQIRNRATIVGNLLQHTRCGYYRHRSFPCIKRGDDACPVLVDGAVQETAGIFGNSLCASAYPGSVAPVLAANGAQFGAQVGPKSVAPVMQPVPMLFRTPEKGRAADVDADGLLISAIQLPVLGADDRCGYEEVRERAAFDWALVSCCVRLTIPTVAGRAAISAASVWLGSVAPAPHRAAAAEKALIGKAPVEATFVAAAEAAIDGATPLQGNRHKVELVKVCVRRALESAMGRSR